jgi:hypothetical protein
MEHEGSLPFSQEPATLPYPELKRDFPNTILCAMLSPVSRVIYQSLCRLLHPLTHQESVTCILHNVPPDIYLSVALQPFVGPWPLFSFLIFCTVCMTPWTGYQPVARPRPTHRTAQTQNNRTQTSMPQVGFEPTIPAFERVKTVHALDRAATVIGFSVYTILNYVFTSSLYPNIFLMLLFRHACKLCVSLEGSDDLTIVQKTCGETLHLSVCTRSERSRMNGARPIPYAGQHITSKAIRIYVKNI